MNPCKICNKPLLFFNIIKLPCNHEFHNSCIKDHLLCPNCIYKPLENISISNNCKICNNPIKKNSYNYIINTNCGCEFHYTCYNNKNKNYYSITIPKCSNCNKLFNKNQLQSTLISNPKEAYNIWIGKKYNENITIESLQYILQYCIGLDSNSKNKIINEIQFKKN